MPFLRLSMLGAVFGAVMLTACAPADIALTRKEQVERAQGIKLRETVQRKIPYRATRTFTQSCLSGMRLADGSARISAVAGSWNSADNYQIATRLDQASNRVIATVSHIGFADQRDAPFVVVEFNLDCQPIRRQS
jgi:hypothetical protein